MTDDFDSRRIKKQFGRCSQEALAELAAIHRAGILPFESGEGDL